MLDRAGRRRHVRSAFRYFVVDEYQDVNPLQKLLLDALARRTAPSCAWSATRQTIYSFTGATADTSGFAADFPDATVVRLVRDYRSTPQVVALANRLAGVGRRRSRLSRSGRPVRNRSLSSYADEDAEAGRAAAERPRAHRGGVRREEIAILVRMNAMLEGFEHAFTAADVPYVVRGARTVL